MSSGPAGARWAADTGVDDVVVACAAVKEAAELERRDGLTPFGERVWPELGAG